MRKYNDSGPIDPIPPSQPCPFTFAFHSDLDQNWPGDFIVGFPIS